MQYVLLVIYAILANVGLVFMKMGSTKGTVVSFVNGMINANFNIFSILGFVFYITSFILYTILISKFNLTYLVPISSALSYLLIFLISIIFLKEQINIYQGIGFFVILVGVILLNIK